MVSVRDMPYTVTNSFKRYPLSASSPSHKYTPADISYSSGLMMRTYAARPARPDPDARPVAKKRRVDHHHHLPSDPLRPSSDCENNLQTAIRQCSAAVLSSPSQRPSRAPSDEPLDDHDDPDDDDDPDHAPSTPPSSPPPPSTTTTTTTTLQLTPPPAAAAARKPTFAFLKRKRALLPAQDFQPPVLRQMQLDLGGDVRRTCGGCGMEYVPTHADDAALHRRFHDRHTAGIDLGKAFVRANASRWVYEAARVDDGYVVIVDRKSSPAARRQARRVLDVVNRELAAPDLDDARLWGQAETPKPFRKNGSREDVDRFRVFLHMKDSRCVGLCLAERIWEAYPVNKPTSSSSSSSITLGPDPHPAIVGISRVWTSAASRRKGIALDLLDCVVGSYFYGLDIPKAQVAFSQPTESGCRLMAAFFGPDEPWHVYKECVETKTEREH
ncbi:hypothetical protein LOY89_006323 [Ophidiomyces ophidiicola]|nr:hypothetical protein LOZ48_006665 [Ophidiomyces ophidiicola]KAI2153647.1 hypothetical protein LOZ25_005230 [Ophidiomyces ophidiicola]KAI2206709.1 hypothetical protein LOZ16_004719 [Ophidiomyces ophidiicola]KAI2365521.1 hypothetical protein LOY89_006323 [Ophidiomyces ophidiicola]KAI2380195.1 hypothetical protein LOY90_006821 [Ophidiomyces ophidiicola]